MPRYGHDAVLLVTGFPSLYARTMIEQVLAMEPRTFLYMTAEPGHMPAAEALLASMTSSRRERIALLEARPTAIDLGLSGLEFRKLTRELDRIHHIVHTNDKAADKKAAFALNVISAAEILEIARCSKNLRCLVLHSTAAVSGEREGVIYEADLDEGQSFKSVVAETRMRAEALARRAMGDIPIAIVRPTTIIGGKVSVEAPLGAPSLPSDDTSSEPGHPSGEVEGSGSPRAAKERPSISDGADISGADPSRSSSIPAPSPEERLDGIHLLVLLLIATPADLAIPLPGRTGDVPLHVVPLDYVVRASRAIGLNPSAPGRTFHLADPNPPSARRVIDLVTKASRQRSPWRVPSDLAKILLRTPGIDRFVRSPRAFVEELMIPVRYDRRNTEVTLAGTGIECPPFESYVEQLVVAVQEHIRARRERRVNSVELEVDDPLS
jgi:hypothetical protein